MNKEWKPNVGEEFAFGLKGIHQVEEILSMPVGDDLQECFVLSTVYSKKRSKTFLPSAQFEKQGGRQLISEAQIAGLGSLIQSIKLNPLDFNWNSNKKMLQYEKDVVEGGFRALIHCYLCIQKDIEVSGSRADKRYIAHHQRLTEVIGEEIASARDVELPDAIEWFESLLKNQTSH